MGCYESKMVSAASIQPDLDNRNDSTKEKEQREENVGRRKEGATSSTSSTINCSDSFREELPNIKTKSLIRRARRASCSAALSPKQGGFKINQDNLLTRKGSVGSSSQGSYVFDTKLTGSFQLPQSYFVTEGMEVRQILEKSGFSHNTLKQNLMFGLGESVRQEYSGIRDRNGNVTVLGKGMEGQVFLARRRCDNRKVALKSFKSTSMEVSILRSLDHPHIVKLFEINPLSEETYCIALELGGGGNLLEYVNSTKKIPTKNIKIIFRQIFQVAKYLKFKNIVHRDLKLENIVFRSVDPKRLEVMLIDFGLSTVLKEEDGKLSDWCGTVQYFSPEVVQQNYGFESDVWSIGIMMYVMLTGTMPYKGKKESVLINEIINYTQLFERDRFKKLNTSFKEFVKLLLEGTVPLRLSPTQALKHPYLVDIVKKEKTKEDKSIILQRVMEFSKLPFLKRISLSLLANELAFRAKEDLFQLFDKIIGDLPSIITVEHFQSLYQDEEPELISKLFSSMDLEGVGFLEVNEFVAATIPKSKYTSNKYLIKRVFLKLAGAPGEEITAENLQWILGDHLKEYAGKIVEEALEVIREHCPDLERITSRGLLPPSDQDEPVASISSLHFIKLITQCP